MQKKLNILYGRERLPVELADSSTVQVIRKPTMPQLADPISAVKRALSEPVTADTHTRSDLATLAQQRTSCCIVICDITRPVPNHLFLRPVVETLVNNGMDLNQISILVATGLHRPNVGDELEELIGDRWILENVSIHNHDARSDAEHIDLGSTSTRGTPVKIDRRLVESELKIATGLVEPHFMAGYSGGRKVIAPGVAHADTIRTFHNFRFMSDPCAVNCNLESNPLHEEQLEIVKKLGGAYAINTVIDEERNLAFVNFGEINASHQEAVSFIENYCRVPVQDPFDVVITCGGGYPLDKTYYQTVKGMVGAMDILKPGGDLIIASECSEGIGSAEYIDAQKRLKGSGPAGFLNSLAAKPLADIDEWQTQMQTKPMSIGNIHLYSSLSDDDIPLTNVHTIDHWSSFIENKTAGKSVAVIPEGPYVIPYQSS